MSYCQKNYNSLPCFGVGGGGRRKNKMPLVMHFLIIIFKFYLRSSNSGKWHLLTELNLIRHAWECPIITRYNTATGPHHIDSNYYEI